jgi:hypothetical protein
MNENDSQLHTLSVLEQLREASKSLWGASSEAYFRVDELLRPLANPNLHDIPRNLPFRVEMWDQSDQHIRWVIAASASVAVGHAAMDAAIANYPDQRFTLRNGILVIRACTHEIQPNVRFGPKATELPRGSEMTRRAINGSRRFIRSPCRRAPTVPLEP